MARSRSSCGKRFGDGKEYRYWSRRARGDRTIQRQILYLGEIDDSQYSQCTAWCRAFKTMKDSSALRQGPTGLPEDVALAGFYFTRVQVWALQKTSTQPETSSVF